MPADPLIETPLSTALSSVFGDEAVKKKKLFFASPSIQGCLPFAFRREDEIFFNCNVNIEERPVPIAFICNSSESMRYMVFEIQRVSSNNFKQISEDIWVTDKKPRSNGIPLNYHFDQDVMDMGLQIFSVKETMQEVVSSGLKDFVKQCSTEKDFLSQIGDMVRREVVTWENVSNKNYSVMLAKNMGFKADTKKVTIDFKK